MASVTTTTTYPGNTLGIKTAVIKPGETFVLPPGATVQTIVTTGSINLDSNCDLPDPTAYKCGYFYFIIDSDDNEGHSMDETQTYYDYLKVADNTYQINRKVIASGENPGTMTTIATLNTHVPDQVVFSFLKLERTNLTSRQGIKLYFKVPESLFGKVELALLNFGAIQFHRPYEYTGDCGALEDLSPIEQSIEIVLGS